MRQLANVLVIFTDEEFRDFVRARLEAIKAVCRFVEFDGIDYALAEKAAPQIVLFAIPTVTAGISRRIIDLIHSSFGDGTCFCVACKSIDRDTEMELYSRGVRGIVTGKNSLARLDEAVEAISRGEIWCTKKVLSTLLENLNRPRE
jgi:DNA-binding NarL/FixJ family response regulator